MTGKAVMAGAICHFSSRRRREVEISESLRVAVESAAIAVRELMLSPILPAPVNDARCRQCSLNELCQPKLKDLQPRYASLLRELYSP